MHPIVFPMFCKEGILPMDSIQVLRKMGEVTLHAHFETMTSNLTLYFIVIGLA